MAAGRGGTAGAGRPIPARAVPAHQSPGNPAGNPADAGTAAPHDPNGTAGADALHPQHPGTGWERERAVFFRTLEDALRQPGRAAPAYAAGGKLYPEDHRRYSSQLRSPVSAGLSGLAALGGLIEDDSEDPEERRKRMAAQQNGSDIGAVLGLAIGAAIALTENQTEEQTIQDEQDYNEFLARMEADEEEQNWQQSM